MAFTTSADSPTSEKKVYRLTVFSFLWACQALVHQEFFWDWLPKGRILGYAVTLAAILLMFNPRSVSLLGLLALVSFSYNVTRWPRLANHIFAEGLINLVILSAVLWTLYQNRHHIGKPGWSWYTLGLNNRKSTNNLLRRFAPVMRASVIIIYLFATLHKLNWDFFDPAISCATTMYNRLPALFTFMPDYHWGPLVSIWGTLIIELVLPVFLIFRKTRYHALALGIPFHLMLGLIGHRTFSAFAFANYFLFTDERFMQALNDRLRALRQWLSQFQREQIRRYLWMGIGIIFLGIVASFAADFLDSKRLRKTVWLVWSLSMIAAYVIVLHRQKVLGLPAPKTALRWSNPGLLWMLPLVVVFNGMNPYLGLKTHVAFAMYSNLRTEGGEWNHIFMPKWLKVAQYQDDLVEVIDATRKEFDELKTQNLLIPHFEFRRMIDNMNGDVWVHYVHNGQHKVLEIKNGQSNQTDFVKGSTGLLGKLLVFRPVYKEGALSDCLR